MSQPDLQAPPPPQYDPPPELRRPTPRKVRYKSWTMASFVWFYRLAAVPVLWLGVLLVRYTAVSFAFWFGAETVEARVTSVVERGGKVEGHLSYEYVDSAGELRTGGTDLRLEEYRAWRENLAAARERRGATSQADDWRPTVSVRAVDLGLLHYSKAAEGEVYYPCGTPLASCCLAVALALWAGPGLGGLGVGAFWMPWRERRLVRLGHAVPGRLVRRTAGFTVEYEFENMTRSVVTGKMTVSTEYQDRAVPGARVTVLYHPRRPTRNVVYEFCDFYAAAP